jgi:single-stranded DNA-binding protein
MADREVVLLEDGVEFYRGKLGGNFDYKRGRIYGDIKPFSAGINFTITVSNGKDRQGEWKPSTFMDCTAFGEKANQIQDRYSAKDEIEFIGKFENNKSNGRTYPKFIVFDVPRMKPEETSNSNAEAGYAEVQSDSPDDLPF